MCIIVCVCVWGGGWRLWCVCVWVCVCEFEAAFEVALREIAEPKADMAWKRVMEEKRLSRTSTEVWYEK